MAEVFLEPLIKIGYQLFQAKLLGTAVHCLWIFDYLLTFGDEVEYAWNGRRSWLFALFIANRYCPVPYIIWSSALLHNSTTSFCRDTKWLWFGYATVVIILAKITIALRIYAVTERNKWIGGVFSGMIVAQLVIGTYSTVSAAMSPIQQLPEVNLELFRFCAYEPSKAEQLIFLNTGVAFDSLAFLVVFFAAKKPKFRYPGIPSILDAILRDATAYFIIIFSCQIISDMFVIFAPQSFSYSPSVVNTVLVPLMASRLMLSLKRASMGSTSAWSLSTMHNARQGTLADRTLHFAPQLPHELRDVPATSASLDFVEEGTELESVSRPPLKDELSLSC